MRRGPPQEVGRAGAPVSTALVARMETQDHHSAPDSSRSVPHTEPVAACHWCRVGGEPYVEVQYENKQVARISTGHLNISQIIDQVGADAALCMGPTAHAGPEGLQLHKRLLHACRPATSTWCRGPICPAPCCLQVQSKAEEMETGQKLKDAGLQSDKIESSWGAALGKESEVGEVQFIPRQA